MRRAGTYAENRYRRGLASWRRRSVPTLVWKVALLDVATLLLALWADLSFVWFVTGGVVGVSLTLLLLVSELPPEAILDWGRGAEGERMTEHALEPLLTEGWKMKHDIQLGAGNIDHLVHGPAGTFLLETKCPRGCTVVDKGHLVTHPIDDPEEKRSLRVDQAINWQLRMIRGNRVPGVKPVKNIRPVVVIWGEFEQRIHESRGIVYLHGDELTDWLRSRLVPAIRPLTELA
jgi:Nuclease-related domain